MDSVIMRGKTFLTQEELASIYGVRVSTIRIWAEFHKGKIDWILPPGERRRRYAKEDIDKTRETKTSFTEAQVTSRQ